MFEDYGDLVLEQGRGAGGAGAGSCGGDALVTGSMAPLIAALIALTMSPRPLCCLA